ncbi:hypothetical protein CVT24_003215 [Panaeolus cyanescens]|uniref:F-box domain-containing protein n=1 Tax=Panaeolus cyanescens TaxID=181874 RepID=A0A409WMU8_9AGAR|nr:hypothetical protein CVT24_003215 [Panaeolus cyanescens]
MPSPLWIAELVNMVAHYLTQRDVVQFSLTNKFTYDCLIHIVWQHLSSPWPLLNIFRNFMWTQGAWRLVGSIKPADLERFTHYAQHVRQIDTLYQRRTGNYPFEEIHPLTLQSVGHHFFTLLPKLRSISIPKALNPNHITEYQHHLSLAKSPYFHFSALAEIDIFVSSLFIADITSQLIKGTLTGVHSLRLSGPHLLTQTIVQAINSTGTVRNLSLNLDGVKSGSSSRPGEASLEVSWNALSESILKLDILTIIHPPQTFSILDVLKLKTHPYTLLELYGSFSELVRVTSLQPSPAAPISFSMNCVFLSKTDLKPHTAQDIIKFINHTKRPAWVQNHLKIGLYNCTLLRYSKIPDLVKQEFQREEHGVFYFDTEREKPLMLSM